MSAHDGPGSLEDVLAEYLSLLEQGEGLDVDSFCAKHPGLRDALFGSSRQVLESLGDTHSWQPDGAPFEQPTLEAGMDAPPSGSDPRERLTWLQQRARRYAPTGEVGRGGMGVVLSVRDHDLDRESAMKLILDPRGARNPHVLSRFLEEAQITGQLEHPGIVPVHALGVDEQGRPFFTMPLVRGLSFKDVITQVHDDGVEEWTLTRALSVLQRICETLAYAHSRGVIHRDLKPANIMVGKYGEAYVMDWGLAKAGGRDGASEEARVEAAASDSDAPSSSEAAEASLRTDRKALGDTPHSPLVTAAGAVLGTPCFMPPEQAGGRLDALGPSSDVYAVGAILYNLLAGAMPYADRAGTSQQIIERVLSGPPRPLVELAPQAPAELVAITERAMARSSDDRYTDMGDMASDLRAYLENRVVRAHRTGPVAELKKWVSRNRRFATALLLLLVIVPIATLTIFWIESERSRVSIELLAFGDLRRIQELETEFPKVYPSTPENLPFIEGWLRRAREFTEVKAEHEAVLVDLQRVGSYVESERRWEFEEVTLAARYEAHRLVLDKVARLESSDPAVSLIARAEQRRSLAQTVAQQTLDNVAELWESAIASISDEAESPRYQGLVIEPQRGLIPVGRDPASGLWEFAHLETGEVPVRGDDGRLQCSHRTGLVLVLIPGGTATVGCNKGPVTEPYHFVDETRELPSGYESPVHSVELDPFFISKYEMTQAQYVRVLFQNPSQAPPGGSRQEVGWQNPLEGVNYNQANFATRGMSLRLPTDVQWEYAARAGTSTPWFTGQQPGSLQGYANVHDLTAKERGSTMTATPEVDDGYFWHAPVGTYLPNAFGLHDVLGNVWEWVLDGGTYDKNKARAGDGFRSQVNDKKPGAWMRGGSFDNDALKYCRSSYRYKLSDFEARDKDVGIRPARAIRGGLRHRGDGG